MYGPVAHNIIIIDTSNSLIILTKQNTSNDFALHATEELKENSLVYAISTRFIKCSIA